MYRVRGWERFQHYRDRDPPWIKLHFNLLSSADWVTLDDRSRVLAIACMLIASRNEGNVPDDPEYIRRVAYLNKPADFKPLIQCGFLEVASECKQMLADAIARDASSSVSVSESLNSSSEDKKVSRISRAMPLPPEFQLTDERKGYAEVRLPRVDASELMAAFRDYHAKEGTTARDWDASWRTWVRNANQFGYPMLPAATKPEKAAPTDEQVTEARRKAAEENVRQLQRLGLRP